MSEITHWLNTTVHVWRHSLIPDGSGGFGESWADQGAIAMKIDQSSAQERVLAQQAGASHTHNGYAEPDADVRRSDRLAASGIDVSNPQTDDVVYEVVSTTTPSTPRYLKAALERIET